MITTRVALFITHADVRIDPTVPVPRWSLSERGIARHTAFSGSSRVKSVTSIYCSGEQKAVYGAGILGRAINLRPRIVEELHENDRSSTGYLPAAEFEATADLFFAHPEQSIRGWERAADAQGRIVTSVDRILRDDRTGGDVAIVAHGGVGALLLCHLAGRPISRSMDQPGTGGGNYFAFEIGTRTILHGGRSGQRCEEPAQACRHERSVFEFTKCRRFVS